MGERVETRISVHDIADLPGSKWAGVMYDFLKRRGVALKDETFYLLRLEDWEIGMSLIRPWEYRFDISTNEHVFIGPTTHPQDAG